MRILYFSDVHLEVRERQAPSSWTGVLPLGFGPGLSAFIGRVDLLVLAGDIGRLRSTRNVSPLSYAQQAAAFLGCRVILVPGNHEYYRGSFDGDRAALLAAEIPGVTVLDRGEARPHRHDQRWADRHRQWERYAVGQANRARFSVGVRQPETSIDLGSRQRPIAVAASRGTARSRPRNRRNLAECRLQSLLDLFRPPRSQAGTHGGHGYRLSLARRKAVLCRGL